MNARALRWCGFALSLALAAAGQGAAADTGIGTAAGAIAGTIAGTVVDAHTGAPVAGATVVVLDGSATSGQTGADGGFTLAAPPRSGADVGARAPGYGRALATPTDGEPVRL
ncbi:carboxypeptidase regulatory-like domain-containing protein, partial [Cupriavidus sp. WS]|uniref:carboxypeptidase regulatory-like domain-containing protein n=1 Tax=Cupriavidus sp. WS TaxID=1312922 RepID=UPI0005B910DC